MNKTTAPSGAYLPLVPGAPTPSDRELRFWERSERLLRRVVEQGVPEDEFRAYLGGSLPYQTSADVAWTRVILKRLLKGERWEDIQQVPRAEAEERALDTHPRYAPFHDILFVRRTLDEDDDDDTPSPKSHRFHRFRAIKEGVGRGGFRGESGEALPEQGAADDGYRAVLNLARVGEGSNERGPILSALPLNPDPAASSSCTCYLLNPSNLNYATAWTAEEWSDQPGDEGLPLLPGADIFRLLIASPGGKVYYVEKSSPAPLSREITGEIAFREVRLQDEPEIWAQLRGGCVVGRVAYTGGAAVKAHRGAGEPTITPLVNIHSLLPLSEQEI